MSANPKLLQTIKKIPQLPGVYRYYDQKGLLLYIGKAKNLKRRVSSYFNKTQEEIRIRNLVSQIFHIEYTIVANEEESFLLEANLIHSQQPKFNIKLKDDKSYVYLKFTKDEIPGIFVTRRKINKKAFYLGPYSSTYAVFETLRTIRTIFPFCQNRKKTPKPCNYYSIKQCQGICAGLEDKESYLSRIENIKNIFQGDYQIAIDELEKRITDAVQVQNYPLAALWRDRLKTLQKVISNQKVVLNTPSDCTLISILKSNESDKIIFSSTIQEIYKGKVVNISNLIHTTDNQACDISEQLNLLLQEINYQNPSNPKIYLKYTENPV